MGELLRELPRPAPAAAALELVRPVGDEPPRGLAARQALGARAEVAKEQLERLARLGPRIGRGHDSIVRVHRRGASARAPTAVWGTTCAA